MLAEKKELKLTHQADLVDGEFLNCIVYNVGVNLVKEGHYRLYGNVWHSLEHDWWGDVGSSLDGETVYSWFIFPLYSIW